MDEPLTAGQAIELTDLMHEAAGELVDALEHRPDDAGEAFTRARAAWWSYVEWQAGPPTRVDRDSDEAELLAAAADVAACIDSMIDVITEYSGDLSTIREGCAVTRKALERYSAARVPG